MHALERLENAGIVPVVVIDDAANAVHTANALLAGGIDVMEITFRTAAARDAIANVAANCPDMLVGAGTVVTLDQCKTAVEAGAKFIVSPGCDEEVVSWCVENNITVTPGCITPTEIMTAIKHGLKVVKFFPAGEFGGLAAMKALAGPFGSIKFIPTGGVNAGNLKEYLDAPYVHAVGGSWICPKTLIAEGNYAKITALCAEARKVVLGFELAHVGINCTNAESSINVCNELNCAFGFDIKEGFSSNFVSSGIEVMKSNHLGSHGHIAIRTRKINAAIQELRKAGYEADFETAKFKNDKMIAIYLKKQFGGFAIHLLQK